MGNCQVGVRLRCPHGDVVAKSAGNAFAAAADGPEAASAMFPELPQRVVLPAVIALPEAGLDAAITPARAATWACGGELFPDPRQGHTPKGSFILVVWVRGFVL